MGSKPTKLGDLPNLVLGLEGPKISKLDSVVDSIYSRISLSLVGNFMPFRPNVAMVRKWCLTKWSLIYNHFCNVKISLSL